MSEIILNLPKAARVYDKLHQLPVVSDVLIEMMHKHSPDVVEQIDLDAHPKALVELISLQDKRWQHYNTWLSAHTKPNGYVDMSGILPWYRQVKHMSKISFWNRGVYEPVTRMLLPEDPQADALGYNHITIHKIPMVITKEYGDENFQLNTLPLNRVNAYKSQEQHRMCILSHGHPGYDTQSIINGPDLLNILVHPEVLMVVATIGRNVWVGFGTDQTPIIDCGNGRKDLAGNRPIWSVDGTETQKLMAQISDQIKSYQDEAIWDQKERTARIAKTAGIRLMVGIYEDDSDSLVLQPHDDLEYYRRR